ncbi:MAG: hypothetical protein KAS23_08590 [Anaerohalosphaera sp.]|nr:hypothetical protein [Anaerohalosphaera sp.]
MNLTGGSGSAGEKYSQEFAGEVALSFAAGCVLRVHTSSGDGRFVTVEECEQNLQEGLRSSFSP